VAVSTGDNAQVNIEIEPQEGSHIFTLTISPEAFDEIIKKYEAKKAKVKKPLYNEIPVPKNKANKIYNVVKMYVNKYGDKIRIREIESGRYLIEFKPARLNKFNYYDHSYSLSSAESWVMAIKE